MKAKTIKQVLRKKVDEWLDTIEDEKLRDDVRRDTIITGGAIVSMLLREPVSDFDVYFRRRETAAAVARYYVERFKTEAPRRLRDAKGQIKIPIRVEEDDTRIKIVVKSAGIAGDDHNGDEYQYFEGDPDPDAEAAAAYVGSVYTSAGTVADQYEETEELALETQDEEGKTSYRPVFLSTNAITLANKVQIIIRFWGEPEEIHENYDFVHCTSYWTSNTGNLVLRPEALEAILTKELRYVGSKYPLCSILRLRKFIKRGWSINAGQILKMCMQVSALDLNDVNVLEDQLTGVDVAYFAEVIDKLREKNNERVDSAYLLEIIDRMF